MSCHCVDPSQPREPHPHHIGSQGVMGGQETRALPSAIPFREFLEEVAAFRGIAEQEHDPILLRLTGEARRLLKACGVEEGK
jgi:hypothetical protein